MNLLFPEPLKFDERSSVADTIGACEKFDIKPPSLNANRLEALLHKTNINEEVQASIGKMEGGI